MGDGLARTFSFFLGEDSFFAQHFWMMIIPTALVMFPLSCVRHISSLSKPSMISMFFVLAILSAYPLRIKLLVR